MLSESCWAAVSCCHAEDWVASLLRAFCWARVLGFVGMARLRVYAPYRLWEKTVPPIEPDAAAMVGPGVKIMGKLP